MGFLVMTHSYHGLFLLFSNKVKIMIHHQPKNCQFRIKLLPSVQTQDTQTAPSRARDLFTAGSLLQFMISHKATDSAHFFMRVKMYEHLPSSLYVLIHVYNHPVKLLNPSLQMRTRRHPATCLSYWVWEMVESGFEPRTSPLHSLALGTVVVLLPYLVHSSQNYPTPRVYRISSTH